MIENEISEETLKKARLKVGFAAASGGIGGSLGANLFTMIARLFHGTDFHIGLLSAISSMAQVMQFVGSLLLRKFRSNKKAYLSAALPGVFLGLASAFFVYNADSNWANKAFIGYITCMIIMAFLGAATANIILSWIGDFVPKSRLGWFMSFKWILVNLSGMVGSVGLGKLADNYPTPGGYTVMYAILITAGLVNLTLMLTLPDRIPKSAVAHNAEEKIDGGGLHFGSFALWCYVAFYLLWAAGRSILMTFTPAFLIERFQFTFAKIAWLGTLQLLVSCFVIYLLGKISDKTGSRKLLMILSGFVALCMFLWVSSAWWGLAPIIVYSILNGAAGQTHSMLAINLGLELFPEKGRSAYIAFSRFFIGIASVVAPFFAGLVLSTFSSVRVVVAGALLDRYVIAFGVGAVITFACVIPLLLLGNRRI